jgi:hypothetical protein
MSSVSRWNARNWRAGFDSVPRTHRLAKVTNALLLSEMMIVDHDAARTDFPDGR